jgi:hypothetical protein
VAQLLSPWTPPSPMNGTAQLSAACCATCNHPSPPSPPPPPVVPVPRPSE